MDEIAPMYSYAQTNIQLFNQLYLAGYSRAELQNSAHAYKLAVQLFSGRFRPSGKTFIAHLVGTASILTQLGVPYQLIIVGLLHAAYSHGDFGTGQTSISKAKRTRVVQVVGQEIEELIARYTALEWNAKNIPAIYEQIGTLDGIERNVLLVRLANELEERLDLGILYSGNCKYQKYAERDSFLLTEMAKRLGYPTLADEFNTVFKELAAAELPAEIFNPTERNYSILVTPNSCQRKLPVYLHHVIGQRFYRWKSLAIHFLHLGNSKQTVLKNSDSHT